MCVGCTRLNAVYSEPTLHSKMLPLYPLHCQPQGDHSKGGQQRQQAEVRGEGTDESSIIWQRHRAAESIVVEEV